MTIHKSIRILNEGFINRVEDNNHSRFFQNYNQYESCWQIVVVDTFTHEAVVTKLQLTGGEFMLLVDVINAPCCTFVDEEKDMLEWIVFLDTFLFECY